MSKDTSKNIIESIQLLPRYSQILCNDAALYFSEVPSIATDERKTVLLSNVKLIKDSIANLEGLLGS